MAAGLEGRTLAEKIADPNRPTWEEYKKVNEEEESEYEEVEEYEKEEEYEEEDEQDADGASEERLAEEGGTEGRLHIGDPDLCNREWQ
jgi:hypothetical protein